MKHLATYMLLIMGGNSAPTKQDITNALAKVGVDVDNERLDQLLDTLKDVDHENLNALMEAGKERLAKFSASGTTAGLDVQVKGGDKQENKAKKDDDKDEEISIESGIEDDIRVNDLFSEDNEGDY